LGISLNLLGCSPLLTVVVRVNNKSVLMILQTLQKLPKIAQPYKRLPWPRATGIPGILIIAMIAIAM
jgi:hypothetical protein